MTNHKDIEMAHQTSVEEKVAVIELSNEQDQLIQKQPEASPNSVSVTAQALWLLFWMANNVLVTMLNKAAFAKVDFKYPYTLSTIHMACNILGAQAYFFFSRTVKPKQLESSHQRTILIFSVIFSLNIAIGNTSLRWVSVNFNQVCRALVPVIVMGISMLYYKKIFSMNRKLSVLPIVFGVGLSFYGDMSFTAIGAFYTIFCVILAALKAVMGGELLTGDLKLHEIDLLAKMCPWAFVEIGLLAILSGEVSEIYGRWDEIANSNAPLVLLFSGLLSFSLNVSSFIANKVTSALTLCIAANVKQVLLVLFSTVYFGDEVGFLNGLGIFIVIVGSFRYGLVSIQEEKK